MPSPLSPLFVSCALGIVMTTMTACASRAPSDAPAPAAPAPAERPAPPPIDAARVLAILTENAPSVAVSLQAGVGGGVGAALQGEGPPAVALELLGSLPARLPGTRAVRLELGTDTWSATLTTTGVADTDPTSLAVVVAAARPVFAGGGALLTNGTLDVTPSLLSFRGTLADGKSLGDASTAVADGYMLAKVDRGPPFALDLRAVPH